LWDVRYQNTTLGVEWTIPIEMWTYFLIPPLFFFFSRTRLVWQWLIFGVAMFVAAKSHWWHQHPLGAQWAIETYLYCFIGGLLAFSYRDKIILSTIKADLLVAFLVFAILCLSLFFGGKVPPIFTLLIMGLILCLFHAGHTRIIFEYRPVVILGNISFSFYLLHYPVLKFTRELVGDSLPLVFVIGLAVTAISAYLCHELIEKPALQLTGKLNSYDR
jgi:peptidoglycan/LPS O-acetylase OafA/YrhL